MEWYTFLPDCDGSDSNQLALRHTEITCISAIQYITCVIEFKCSGLLTTTQSKMKYVNNYNVNIILNRIVVGMCRIDII